MADETRPISPEPPRPPDPKGANKSVSSAKPPAFPKQLGPYLLVERIGVGGMGWVYRATREDDPVPVAIKVMSEHTRSNPVLLRRFEQEFRAASRLNHPNMVRAIDYGEAEGIPYLVMELVEGKTLSDLVEEKGKLPEADAIRLVGQVAQGLHRAHKLGLVHRDVKPDNILINAEGQAKLTDLGLVKEAEGDMNLTRTGRGLGTPHYMAPEQFKNAKLADFRCDIYSLGATLYHAITGQTPFGGFSPLEAWMKKVQDEFATPKSLVPGLSERTDWAIRRAMASDPKLRPATCREFVEDLTGRTTRKVLSSLETDSDNWYLKYLDEQGSEVSVRGSRGAVRRSLRDGLLGDASNIQASRSRQGPFKALRELPEFRDLILLAPVPGSVPRIGLDTPVHSGATPREGSTNTYTNDSDPAMNATIPTDSGFHGLIGRMKARGQLSGWILAGVTLLLASLILSLFFLLR